MDDLTESRSVGYRSLQMPGFMDNMLQQLEPTKSQDTFFSPIFRDRKLPTCATRDIAAVAAKLPLDDSWRAKTASQSSAAKIFLPQHDADHVRGTGANIHPVY